MVLEYAECSRHSFGDYVPDLLALLILRFKKIMVPYSEGFAVVACTEDVPSTNNRDIQ